MAKSAYFQLSKRLQSGISSTLRWSEFRPVQDLTIEAVFAEKNAIVLAPTAGGKTEAAFFPILDLLHLKESEGVGCIYVSPLRALLNNQEGRVGELARLVGLTAFKWHGDVGGGPKKRFLNNPADVLMTTPESLEVLLMTGRAGEHELFSHTRFVVIDEIHAFAADDRGAHLMSLLERIQKSSDTDIQRIGLSATVGNPDELSKWMQGSSVRDRCVVDPPRGEIQRRIAIRFSEGDPEITAASAVPLAENKKTIFFTQGRAASERVRTAFSSKGVEVFVHHSSVSRELREEAEAKFMESQGTATMVSTSTLELGIDVGDLNLVLQLDAPSTVSSFLQRLGRTGRRPGESQHMEFFTSKRESLLQSVALVNLARGGYVEDISPSSENLPVLLHQILASVVARNAIRRESLWKEIQGPSPFTDIKRDTFDEIVDHLIKREVLVMVDHRLAFGDEGERIFGGMNFFNLYAVFETAAEVAVKTRDGRVVGALETIFVRRMQHKTFIFLLAGRTWIAVDVDLSRNLVIAEPFASGEAPRWHGAGGFLGYEVANAMRNVLISNDQFEFVDDKGRKELESMRQEVSKLLPQDRCPITTHGDKIRVHTYAGGKVNATIAALLEYKSPLVEVSSLGDLEIDLKSPSGGILSAALARHELHKIRKASEEFDRNDLAALVSGKQRGKLAKFQPYLPPELEGSYLAERLFDIEGASKLAQESEFRIC